MENDHPKFARMEHSAPTHLSVDSAACLRTSDASTEMKKRMGGSCRSDCSTKASTFSATSDGVSAPEVYAST